MYPGFPCPIFLNDYEINLSLSMRLVGGRGWAVYTAFRTEVGVGVAGSPPLYLGPQEVTSEHLFKVSKRFWGAYLGPYLLGGVALQATFFPCTIGA